MKISTEKRIIKNVSFRILEFILTFPIPFILTPFIIKHIGNHEYGIWILMMSILGYVRMFSVDINTATIKYVSEYQTKGNKDNVANVVGSATLFFLIICTVIGVCLIPLMDWVLPALSRIPPSKYQLLKTAFIICMLSVLIQIVFSGLHSSLAGMQKFNLYHTINIITRYLGLIFIFIFLELGFGLRGVTYGMLLTSIIFAALDVLAVRKFFPLTKIFNFNFTIFKRIISFTYKSFIATIANMINLYTDKIILSIFLGPLYVTFYSIGTQLTNNIRFIPTLFTLPLTPTTSELEVKGDEAGIKRIYYRFQKYLLFIAFVITLGLLIFCRPFIQLWLGEGYQKTIQVITLLSWVYLFAVITIVPFFMLSGLGKPIYGSYASIVCIGINVPLTILFIKAYGYLGVVYATAVAFFASGTCLVWMFHKVVRIPFKPIIPYILKLGVLGGLAFIFSRFLPEINGWFDLIWQVLCFLLFYILFSLPLRYFDRYDVEILKSFITPLPI